MKLTISLNMKEKENKFLLFRFSQSDVYEGYDLEAPRKVRVGAGLELSQKLQRQLEDGDWRHHDQHLPKLRRKCRD